MFAIVVRESGDPAQIEAIDDQVMQNVAGRAGQAPGFVSGTWMSDGSGATLAVLVFDSEGTARGALERVRNAPRPPFMAVDSAEVYRVRATA